MAESNEKVYTIPLRDAWKGPCKKRSKKCMFVIREFVKRHMKTDNVKIGVELNHQIWANGIKNPPRKVKVQVVPHEDAVWVELQGVKLVLEKKEDKEKKKEGKKEETAEAAGKEAKTEEKGAKPALKEAEAKKDTEAKPAAKVKKETKPTDDAKKEKKPPVTEKKKDPSKELPSKAKLQ
ncbi:MAG: 50S ribosomal protein L31e [archaeon]